MTHLAATQQLTHHGVMAMLLAAIASAEDIGQPQCIVIVDASGMSLVEFRMSGAKFLSVNSARTKARTAASIRAPSSNVPEPVRTNIGLATQGQVTGLAGGVPIQHDGQTIGAIGVGSGSPEDDLTVAHAAIAALDISTN